MFTLLSGYNDFALLHALITKKGIFPKNCDALWSCSWHSCDRRDLFFFCCQAEILWSQLVGVFLKGVLCLWNIASWLFCSASSHWPMTPQPFSEQFRLTQKKFWFYRHIAVKKQFSVCSSNTWIYRFLILPALLNVELKTRINNIWFWSESSHSWNCTVSMFAHPKCGSLACHRSACTPCRWSASASEVMDSKTLPAPVSCPCLCAVNRLMRDVNKVTAARWKDKSTVQSSVPLSLSKVTFLKGPN